MGKLVNRVTRRVARRIATAAKSAVKRKVRGVLTKAKSRGLSTASRAMKRLLPNQGPTYNAQRSMLTANTYSTATFYGTDLTASITQGTTTTQRAGNFIMMKYIDLKMLFKNAQSTAPLMVRMAVMTPKTVIAPDTALSAVSNFFREEAGANYISWADATLTNLAKHTRPINTDEWIIHMQRRFILGNSAVGNVAPIQRLIKRKIKCNFKMSYSAKPAVTTTDQPILLFIWCNLVNQLTPTPVVNALDIEQDIKLVFDGSIA